MKRRLACAFALIALWLLILGAAAQVRWDAPLLPRERVKLDAHDFHIVMGAGVEDGRALRVGSVGDDGNALQMLQLPRLQAADFSVLRYRFNDFPRTLELSLVFRRADAPDDVQAVTVPWPSHGWRSVDLSRVPEWRGEIIELGFAEYPTPQVAPEKGAFKPFRFDRAELWSPSWRGSFAALYTSWFGYTPWALLSVSALGPQREVAVPPPLLPFAVGASIASLIIAALILGWSRAQLARRAALTACGLWMLLDAIWLDDLHAKHQLTETVYAGKPWHERETLMADQDIVQAAAQARAYFATRGATARVLVGADSKYVFLKLIYLLLPLDAAPLQQLDARHWPQRDTFVLLYRDSVWRYDAKRGTLVDANGMRPGEPAESIFDGAFDKPVRLEPVLEQGELHLYAPREGAP